VEEDPTDLGARLALDLLGDVPTDRFTFTIRVGRDVDLIRVMRGFLDLGQRLFLAGDRNVLRSETLLDVDAELFFREVADVTDGRFHAVAAPEVLAQGLRLARGLHDDERAATTRAVGFHHLLGHSRPP
jgi:hypothetical protein